MKNLFIICIFVLLTVYGFMSAEKKMVIVQQIDRDLNTIINSENVNKLSSNTYAYIKAQPVEFNNIVSQKQIALDHFLNKFEKSKENGLEEYIMAAACVEILGEKNPVNKWESGRGWYEKYLATNKR